MSTRATLDDYMFLQIADALVSVNQYVNLMGVVVETTIPKKTRGSDCFILLKIVDESHPNIPISVNIFIQNIERLPKVNSAGDIILLFHVMMKVHDNEVYALFNKKHSSFALFEGKYCTNFAPYQTYGRPHIRGEDRNSIASLRKLTVDCQLNLGLNDLLSLREIKEEERFSLICKILHISQATEDEWLLYVWDGTDTPTTDIKTKLEDERENSLPLQLEPIPLSRDILSSFPAIGTVLRVIVNTDNGKVGIWLIERSRWVKLLNCKCEVKSGLWRGMLTPYTRFCYLLDHDDAISQRQRFYEERVKQRWKRKQFLSFPQPSPITETDYPNVRFVTLMDVLTYREVTAKFKCVVRVVAAIPWRAEDFLSAGRTYRIRLTLEDPTARIHAYMYGEEAKNFFGGYPEVDILTRKWNILLGAAETDDGKEIRNPPWVQVCLFSYHRHKSDIWGSRTFRIFATRMV